MQEHKGSIQNRLRSQAGFSTDNVNKQGSESIEYSQEPEILKLTSNAKQKIIHLQDAIGKIKPEMQKKNEAQNEDNYCLGVSGQRKDNNMSATKFGPVAPGMTLGYGQGGFIIQSQNTQN